MKMKAYQNELIDIVSERTGQNKEIVTAYIMAHFEEIEKLLTKTSWAKVNGLGIFRVMKTAADNKVLFLPKFDNIDEVAKNIQNATEAETTISTSSLNEEFEFISQNESLSNNSGNILMDSSNIQLSNEPSNSNGTEEIPSPYSTWDDFYSKKKRTNSLKIAMLLLIATALLGLIAATAF